MLSVGQTLWMVPSARYAGPPCEVTVTRVGRKWAEISRGGYRIDKTTLYIDGGDYSSPGRCYLTRAEHDNEVAMQRAWDALRNLVERKYTPPDGMTVEAIRAALVALGATSETSKE